MPKQSFNMSALLNAQSMEKQNLHHDNGKWFDIRQIPLDKITPSPKNEYGMREIEQLAASIAFIGLLHNIVVREADDHGTYEIISGERRYRAFQLLAEEDPERYSTIPCKVEVKIDNVFAEFLLLQANATARELTDYEKAFQGLRMKAILKEMKANGYLKTLQEKGLVAKGRIRETIADMFDVSSGQVSRWESIFSNLSNDFQQEFKAENIGLALAYDLSLMAPTDQEILFTEYRANGIGALKDALWKNSKPETDTLPTPASIQDDDFKELTHLLAKKVNVQKQDHRPKASPETGEAAVKERLTKPLIGTDAQYQSLLQLGIEANLNMSYAKDTVNKAKFTERLEAFAMVADEFGFGRKAYLDDVSGMLQEAKN